MKTDTSDHVRTPGVNAPVLPRLGLSNDASLRDMLMMLWRRKAIVAGVVVLAAVATAAMLSVATPRYTATTTIAMEQRGITIADLQQVASGLPGDEQTFNSEIAVLQSRDLAEQVIDRLGLMEHPEFNPALESGPGRLGRMLGGLGLSDAAPPDPGERQNRARVSTIDTFLDRLDAAAAGRTTRVIEVRFTSEDPELAARIANTLVNVYLANQVETKVAAATRASELLSRQVMTMRQKAEESEKAIERFRADAGLLRGAETTFKAQQTAEINSQLVLAEAALAEAEARYKEIERLLDSEGGVETAAEVLDSPLIRSLREQLSGVERNLADFANRYGPQHPRMIRLKAERQDLENTIREEIDKILKSYENERSIARARYESLQRSLTRLEEQVGEANSAAVELRSLEREAEANQVMLESFLARVRETSAQQELDMFSPDAKVISRADVPLQPSFPKPKLMMALAVIGASFIGLLLAFVAESLDDGLRSVVDVEEGLGVPLLALVPGVKRPANWRGGAAFVAENGSSALAHSIRALQRGITHADKNAPPKTILVTSVQPSEGKTTISACLARIGGMTDAVIVLDADFHRPGIAAQLGVENGPGLADVLAGEARLEDVIYEDKASGAHYVTAGNASPATAALLGSGHMRAVLEQLEGLYDMIIIDSPPLMAVSDARSMAELVDATVLVVRWGHTKRDIVRLGIRQILSSSGRLAGLVLSQVDVRKNSLYGYPDSGAYNGKLTAYYSG